jgi:hypothetical protein
MIIIIWKLCRIHKLLKTKSKITTHLAVKVSASLYHPNQWSLLLLNSGLSKLKLLIKSANIIFSLPLESGNLLKNG